MGQGRVAVERKQKISSHYFLEGRTSHCISQGRSTGNGFPFKMNIPRYPRIGWMGKNIYKHTYPQMICILKYALHKQIRMGEDALMNSYTCVVKTALGTFAETQ